MKNIVKKAIALLIVVAALVSVFGCANSGVVDTSTEVAVTVQEALLAKTADGTLQQYMDVLVAEGHLTYQTEKGMLITLNGKTADGSKNQYWLIYTDDAEYGSDAYGTYTYEEKAFLSAILGVESLPVKAGATYVFAISQF